MRSFPVLCLLLAPSLAVAAELPPEVSATSGRFGGGPLVGARGGIHDAIRGNDRGALLPDTCIVECPPGGQVEGEPPCGDGYYDSYNSGCGGTGWTLIQPQDGNCGTMCARSCTFLYNGASYRDTDWYAVLGAGGPLTVTGTAEFPLQLLIIYGASCANLQYVIDSGDPCQPVSLSWNLAAGQECWLWAGPSVFTGVEESNYTLDVCGIAPTAEGACCWYGGCVVSTQQGCEGSYGFWQGPDTVCEPDPCPPVYGACCRTYDCEVTTYEECQGGYHRFLPNLTCEPYPCNLDNPGACCLPSGECERLTAYVCGERHGYWVGTSMECTPGLCDEGPAACCWSSGSCSLVHPAWCEREGGVPLGQGTDCDPNPCGPDPVGVCCYLSGACRYETHAECGGSWLGAGFSCSPNPCTTSGVAEEPQVETSTWGGVKSRYRDQTR